MFLFISYEKLPFLPYNYISSSIDKKIKLFWCKFKASKLIFFIKDGNEIVESERQERQPFRGKPRHEDDHPFDRRDGTGRGRRGVPKEGHGKGNWGSDRD